MSHTTEIKTLTFTHNGDYSGDIQILDQKNGCSMALPSDELFEFFGRYLQRQEESRLGRMSGLEYIREIATGIKTKPSDDTSIGTY